MGSQVPVNLLFVNSAFWQVARRCAGFRIAPGSLRVRQFQSKVLVEPGPRIVRVGQRHDSRCATGDNVVDGDRRSVGENGDGGRVGRPGCPLPNFRRVYDPGNGGGGGGEDTAGVVWSWMVRSRSRFSGSRTEGDASAYHGHWRGPF